MSNPDHLPPDDEKNNQAFFTRFFYDSPVPGYSCDLDGHILLFNQAALALWGRPPELGKTLWCGFWKIFYPGGQEMPLFAWPMARAIREGKALDHFLIQIEREDHTRASVMVYPKLIFDEHHTCIGGYTTMVDVTERQFTDKKAILSAIIESTDNAIISKNLDGKVTSWNPGAELIFGYSEKEMLGQSILKIIPVSRQQEETEILSRIKKGERIEHLQTVRLTKAGHEVPLSLIISPVRDKNRNIIGASKIARDITEELRVQQTIKKNTQNLETLNALGKEILEELDVKAVLQKVADATTKITAAQFGVFFYHSIDEDGLPVRLFSISGLEKEAFTEMGIPRQSPLFDFTFQDKQVLRSVNIDEDPRYGGSSAFNGQSDLLFPISSYMAVPVISTSGEVVGSLIFGHRDKGVFTNEHEVIVGSVASHAAVALENSALFEGIKMLSAKKDEFIALASHELKTPITSIKGYLQVSARKENDELGAKYVKKALVQVDKLNALVSDLLDSAKVVAGKIHFNFELFDFSKTLLEVIDTFSFANKSHEIVVDLSPEAYVVYGDQQRLEQVMINLLSNAVKYSPNAAKIYVTSALTPNTVTVFIKDQGMGISQTQKKLIFTRFYRVEAPANISGLGLGLYLTKEIIERHQGSIGVTSELGSGSTFYFSLPLSEEL